MSFLPDSFVQEGQQVFCATLRVNSHNRSEVSPDVWFSVSRRLGVATTAVNAHESYIPACAHFWGSLKLKTSLLCHWLLAFQGLSDSLSLYAGICYH